MVWWLLVAIGLSLSVGGWIGREAQKRRDERYMKRADDLLWLALAALHDITWDPERDDPEAIDAFNKLTAKLRQITGTTVEQIKSYTGKYVQRVKDGDT